MSLETILQALETEAGRQLAAIEQTAAADMAQIETEAEAQAAQLRQEQLAAIRLPLKTEQTRRLNQARLQALQIVLSAREEMLATALDATRHRLAEFSRTPAYGHWLGQLAQESTRALGAAQPVRLLVRAEDASLLPPGGAMTVEAEPPGNGSLGGLMAVSADGRIRVINTLEMRFAQAARRYRPQLAEWLFGKNAQDE